MNFLFVGGGAAIGAICRYDLSQYIKRRLNNGFPWATLAVNLLGTILLGILAARLNVQANFYLFAGIGFCGGFTTFSTMTYEAITLWRQQSKGKALIYLSLTVVLGVICFMTAFKLFNV
ncbi:fluoride efflux transporter CrcB [Agrilactobacillus yilanensis]|uniref:Fluoride-specific ion channel FluC n=1 Tax=Agrilactobacillus yilanensis TaxID=2485997 RepID=A0ABW4J5J4_9LACO|nr:fluoride efflux transporter CrcB [Agrilactobacillus yilanensis]